MGYDRQPQFDDGPYLLQGLMGHQEVLKTAKLGADLGGRWPRVVLFPVEDLLGHDGCPAFDSERLSPPYRDLNVSRPHLPATRAEHNPVVLAGAIRGNDRQVSVGFLAVFNSFHAGGDVDNSKVEIDLAECKLQQRR